MSRTQPPPSRAAYWADNTHLYGWPQMFHRPVPTYCFLEGVFQEEPLACLALLKSELYNAKEINR